MQKGIARKVCMKGLHVMTEENTYTVPKTGQRYCKACRKHYRQLPPIGSTKNPLAPTVLSVLIPYIGVDLAVQFRDAMAQRGHEEAEVFHSIVREYIQNGCK